MRLQKKFQKQFGVRQKWDQKSQVLALVWSRSGLSPADGFGRQTNPGFHLAGLEKAFDRAV